MAQWNATRRGLLAAVGLVLFVLVLQWAITRLRPQPAPATAPTAPVDATAEPYTPTPTAIPGGTPAAIGESGDTYRVRAGDTCKSIAWMFGVPIADLLQANGLSSDCPLGMGMLLHIPPSPWAPPDRLGPDSTAEQIRARVRVPAWQRLWLAGTRLTRTNGKTQVEYGQAYLTRNGEGWMLLSTPFAPDVATPPTTLSLLLTSQHGTDGYYSMVGAHPFLDPVFPLSLDDPSLTPKPRFEEVYAERIALVVDWGPNRLWIDEDSGLILRWKHYRQGEPPDGDLDLEVDYSIVVFDPPPMPSRDAFTEPPARTDAPETAWLTFESIGLTGEDGSTRQAARVFAGDTYLGALDLGQADYPPPMSAGDASVGAPDFGPLGHVACDRSPDGRQLAWIVRHAALGNLLAWTALDRPAHSGLGFDLPHPLGPPSWAPDSRRLAFAGCLGATCGLFVVEPESGQAQRLLDLADATAPPLWSPDGAALAVLHMAEEGAEVVVVRVADGAVTYRGPFDADAWQPAPESPLSDWGRNFPREVGSFSRCLAPPDAWQPPASLPADLATRPLTFTLHTGSGLGDQSVLAEVHTEDGLRLGVLDLGGNPYTFCRRSPDGLHLAYARFPYAANAQFSAVYLADVRALNRPRRLVSSPYPLLAFSPDGGRLAVFGSPSASAGSDVALFDTESGALLWQATLYPDGAFPYALVWHPTGDALAVVGTVGKSPHAWAFAADDGTRLLDEALSADFRPRPGSALADWGVSFQENASWNGLQDCRMP